MEHTGQVISDIHLDVRDNHGTADGFIVPKVGSLLILCGDIAPFIEKKYRDFLVSATQNHPRVAYVPGNHEFYGSSITPSQGCDYMESVCASLPSQVVLLRANGRSLVIPESRIAVTGATLWTNQDPKTSMQTQGLLNDFNQIKMSPSVYITPSYMNELHNIDKEWIDREVRHNKSRGLSSIIATHHSPDRRLSVLNESRVVGGYGPLYYCSDMEPTFKRVEKNGAIAWCYGHTHESHMMNIPKVGFPFVTNALGYPDERTGFASGAGINFSTGY